MEDSKDAKEDIKPVDVAPSRSTDLSKTLPEEAFNNFLQGKRHMLVQDYTYAVQSLAKACELYTEHFGELAIECGEVYFLYGKALFRLSQQHAGVLGDALNEEVTEDEKTSEEEKENESEKSDSDAENDETGGDVKNEEEAMDADEGEKEPSESTDSPQAEEVPKGLEDEVKDSKEESTAADAKPENGEPNETNEEEEKRETEEDDLELAWNSLETAKTIFMRQGKDNSEAQLKVAEIIQLLAEISMESDNNPAAIADLKECLEIKKKHLKPDDRLLAETYYQMGLAEMLNKDYLEAIENFETTMRILQLRIDNLKSTPIVDKEGSFEKADIEKEIEDLESVVVDIKEKIEDTRELIKNARTEIEEALGVKSKTVEVGFPQEEKAGSSSKPVSNITHLLKRKKPEKEEEKESESKRAKLGSTAQNGDSLIDK